MILLPGYGKKHFVAFAFVAAAVASGWSLSHGRFVSPAADPGTRQGTVTAAPQEQVTMEGYLSAVAEADKRFAAGDVSAVSSLLAALETIRVPREGMSAHQELVTAVAAYRDALAADDGEAAASSLSRLRSFAQANPWCGLQP